jgi:hypothetical protein
MAHQHTRIIRHPFADSLQGALLDSYEEKQHRGQLEIVLNVRALEPKSSELLERAGVIHERIEGMCRPIRIQFSGASELRRNDFFTNLNHIPHDDSVRTVEDMLSWRQPERSDIFVLVDMRTPDLAGLMFFSRRVTFESLAEESTTITLERDWSPSPPMPGRLVPKPKRLHQRFGGDPITIHLDSGRYRQRLFIGGIEIQPKERPQVDVVFNVGEKPSNWIKNSERSSLDRWENKGEGTKGMSLGDIRNEAEWLIQRLRNNQRVLVHCAAGMNRSSTICCAALILLEGLTAEQALERVRQHHPWARPDSGHWLKLRWLAKTNS